MKIGKPLAVRITDDLGYVPISIEYDCQYQFQLLFDKRIKRVDDTNKVLSASNFLYLVYVKHYTSIRSNLPAIKYPNIMNKIMAHIKKKIKI